MVSEVAVRGLDAPKARAATRDLTAGMLARLRATIKDEALPDPPRTMRHRHVHKCARSRLEKGAIVAVATSGRSLVTQQLAGVVCQSRIDWSSSTAGCVAESARVKGAKVEILPADRRDGLRKRRVYPHGPSARLRDGDARCPLSDPRERVVSPRLTARSARANFLDRNTRVTRPPGPPKRTRGGWNGRRGREHAA